MARKLIVEIIGDSTKLVRSLNQSTVAANKFGAEVTGSAGRAEKSLSRLQRVAAGGFIGAAAFSAGAVALRRVFDAASESQQVLGQTQVALEATGKSWAQYGEQIQDAVRAQSRLGFDDEALFRTFSLFVRQAGDVGEALRRNNIAMDVARARFIDLEQAALLVNKAALGQAGALRRVGIDARKGADGVELLALLERQFGGAAESASTQAIGATDRLRVSLENVEETIGSALLPGVTKLAGALSDVADGATTASQNLNKLASVKIPVIEIPLKVVFEGGVGNAAGPLGFLGNFLPPQVREALRFGEVLADLLRDVPEPDTRAAAKMFDDRVDSFVDGLERGRDDAVDKGNQRLKAFGQEGFKALKTNELGARLQAQFDALMESLDLRVDQATFAGNTARALDALDETEAAIRRRIASQGRTTALLRQLLDVEQQRKQITDAVAAEADKARQDRLAKALERQQQEQERVNRVLEGLGIAVDRAALTRRLDDDLAALNALADGLRTQIRRGNDVVRFQQELASVVGQIAGVREEIQQRADEAAQARQFRALGLSVTGDEIVPGIENLAKRIQGALRRIESGDLDVGSKIADRLKFARKLIRKEGKDLTDETRSVINDLIKAATGGQDKLDQLVKRQPIDLDRVFGQFSPRQTFAPGVTAPARGVSITGPITVVADDPDAFLAELQKKAGRSSATARGRYPGQSLGLG